MSSCSDIYEYKDVSENSKQFAITNLNENASQVNAHIDSFRRWVKSMPHLNCPTDSKFLLKFLRVAKFDHKKAEKRLDNFCTIRTSPRGAPEYFNHTNIDKRTIIAFFESQTQIPLGRNDAGESVILLIAKNWDSENFTLADLMTAFFMGVDILLSEEETQIHGLKFFLDLKDVSRKTIESWSNPKYVNKLLKILQDSQPMRLRGLIFLNEPKIFDIFFSVFLFFMKDKMKQRILRVKSDMKKVIEKNPGLEKILPSEYGGQGGSLSSCQEKWKERYTSYFKTGHPWACVSVDESKRPEETSKFLAEYKEYNKDVLGIQGTYTNYDDLF